MFSVAHGEIMRVAHVVEAWAGGIATYVSNLIDYQTARGYDVTLIADKDQLSLDARTVGAPIIHYCAHRNPLRIYQSIKQVQSILNREKFNIIHAHSTFPGIYTRFSSNSEIKVIYTPHAWSFLKQDIGPIQSYTYKKIEQHLSSKSKKIICMSYEELDEAISAGIPAEKIELIHTGIPNLDFDESPSKTDNTQINVGFFGRLDYQKGYDSLIQADKYLSDNINLHIYGGAIRDAHKSAATTPSLRRVTHHGWLDQSQICEEIRKMDIIIIPSRWEGFALAPLEAMRAGKGLVVSNMSSLPEVVINGFNGLILKNIQGEEIARTLNALTKADCARYGKNAREVFKDTFEINSFIKKLDICYHD